MNGIIASSYIRNGLSSGLISYTASADNMPNPDRGFYRMVEKIFGTSNYPLSISNMQDWRNNESLSIVLRLFYLTPNIDGSPISAPDLTFIQDDFDKIETAGLKCIVRFAYTDDTAAVTTEPVLADIVDHIIQLAPVINANKHLIVAVQQGFIGAYGEGYYATNFGTEGAYIPGDPMYDPQFQIDRNAVLQAMLDNFDASIFIQARTTRLIYQFLGDTNPLLLAEAFTGSDRARLGLFNDALMAESVVESVANGLNAGTYEDEVTDRTYVSNIGKFTPIIGETYDPNDDTENEFSHACINAEPELRQLKFSSVHIDYHLGVVGDTGIWETQGCRPDIMKELGYRFRLNSATIPLTASGALAFTLNMINDGYARPFNERKTFMVFRDTTTDDEYPVEIPTDCRLWEDSEAISESISLATVPNGEYDLFLWMPDLDASLKVRPEYSIQLANTGLWESLTGYNALNRTITIT